MPHLNRSLRRYGHLPGHIRDAFHAAVEAFGEWDDGDAAPFVDFEIDHRPRRISLAQACGLVWGCTDVFGQDGIVELEMYGIDLAGLRTYGAAARALLARLKETPGGVIPARDAQLQRLFDRRDRRAERLEGMLGVRDLGKPPAALDHTEQMQIRFEAERLVEHWQEQPDGAIPEDEDRAIARELAAIIELNQKIDAAQSVA